MMEGWKYIKLGDIIHIKHGYGFKGEYFVEEPNHNFLLTPGNFAIGGGYKSDKMKYYEGPINEEFVLSRGDVIVTMTDLSKQADTLGYSAKIPNDPDNTYLHNQRLGLVSLKTNDFDIDYIYWLLRTQYYQKYIAGSSSGATVKHTSPKKIYSTKLLVPESKETQRKIASILSAYDDLIENNLKRIKLLEEKAQLTYKEWFSVKGIPDGWKEYKLGELIDFHIGGGWGVEFQTEGFPDPAYVIRGTDMDKLPLGSIQNVPNRWHKVSNLKSRRLQHGDIVFEVSGGSSYEGVAKTLLITKGLLNQFDGGVMCASFCKLMRPKSISYSYALILFLKYLRKTKATEIFEKRSASNIVNYNWEAFLKFQTVKIPNDELLTQFNNIAEPMISSIYNLGNQITKLKEARDILLPRLMTGMIDVEQMNLETLKQTTA